MARAVRFAAGDGPCPIEYSSANLVREYGAPALYGRPLYAREIIRMNLVSRVIQAYNSRQAALNWVTWEKSNPSEARLLRQAEAHDRNKV